MMDLEQQPTLVMFPHNVTEVTMPQLIDSQMQNAFLRHSFSPPTTTQTGVKQSLVMEENNGLFSVVEDPMVSQSRNVPNTVETAIVCGEQPPETNAKGYTTRSSNAINSYRNFG